MEHVYLTLQEISKAREMRQITKSEEAELLKRINMKKVRRKSGAVDEIRTRDPLRDRQVF